MTEIGNALKATASLYDRVKNVISWEAWAHFAPDIVAIQELKKQRKAIVLAHNYMVPEVFYGVADIVGDSLALAREAAQQKAEVIVMAGVSFMAETAKLMNPESMVLIPDASAGCSLADAITPQDVRALREKHPGVPIITYVNTSAVVKAECDICCTSGNAKKIVESLGVPEVIMVPDRYLAGNVAQETDVKIITFNGACEVHELFTSQDVRDYRAHNKGIAIIAHPECPPEVVAEADFAGSTVQMSDWVKGHKPEKALLLTESSMSDNVAALYPEIEFVRPCHACPHMKKITLKNIRASLETKQTEVLIDEAIIESARQAVERMMKVS